MITEFHGLKLDKFQVNAFESIHNGESVIVSAPTGSGKTLLVDYAIDIVLASFKRLIYTSPIKALSNQKYRDFLNQYGRKNVGILTGDVSINRDAPILIMTTEILRNMLYIDAKGTELKNLGYVVFDEIHYINDPARGVVWEESLILIPSNISIIMLSATIPNANDLKIWMESIKNKQFTLITHKERPVPLHLYYYAGKLMHYEGNIELNLRAIRRIRKKQKNQRKYKKGRKKEDKILTVFGNDYFSPIDIISSFDNSFFPVIYFIFSRKACEKAARFLYEAHTKFLSKEEAKLVNNHINEYKSKFSTIADFAQVSNTLLYVKSGIAFHHAGCIPVLKEFVETLFTNGLIKILFATETFAMGLNLPAKSVVFHSIEKFDGREFRLLMAGEFNQMAGRAGRRGIDTYGNVVVIHNLKAHEDDIKGILEGDPEPLESQFRLSYNSICNLLEGRDITDIITLLKSSFKEHSVELIRQSRNRELEIQKKQLEERIKEGISCTRGLKDDQTFNELDKFIGLNREYRAFHTKITLDTTDTSIRKLGKLIWNQKLALGRVVTLIDKKFPKLLGVIIGHDQENKIMDEENFFPVIILDERGRTRRYLPDRYYIHPIIYPYNHIKPDHYNGDKRAISKLFNDIRFNIDQAISAQVISDQKITAESMIRQVLEDQNINYISSKFHNVEDYQELALEIEKHPCFECEVLKEHKTQYYRIKKLKQKSQQIHKKIMEAENLSFEAFKSMLAVLEDFRFVKNNELEEKGYILANIHHDNDVLITEVIYKKLLRGLKIPDIIGMFAMLSLERKESGSFERYPKVRSRKLLNLYSILKKMDVKFLMREQTRKVPNVNINRGFSLRLVELARLWSLGHSLEDLTPLTTMSEGDIINHLRRVLNLMSQIKLLLFKIDIGVAPEIFEKALLTLKRSHIVPPLEELIDEDVFENLLDNEDESNEDSYYDLKLR